MYRNRWNKRPWPDAISAAPEHENGIHVHGKRPWPEAIPVAPKHENRFCFHGKIVQDRAPSLLNAFFIVVIFIILFPLPFGFAAPISKDRASEVAENFILLQKVSCAIIHMEPVSHSGQTVGYHMKLDPKGYILVAGDTLRVPIKAYSFATGFDELPPIYVEALLRELYVSPEVLKEKSQRRRDGVNPTDGVDAAHFANSADSGHQTTAAEAVNRSYWDYLGDSTHFSGKTQRAYTPDTFLIMTQWNQGYPYNKFFPYLGDTLTLTGCVQTAVAQVMRYHAHPISGSGVFTHEWNGQTLTAVMNRPFNWSAMPDTVDGSSETYRQEEVAALMRDLGVMNEAEYGIDGTSAYFHSEAFSRAFGYAPIYTMDSEDVGFDTFFSTIGDEIDAERPVLLSLPGHLTVADGYASDGSGRRIHVNMGWGGAHDDYYYLDETIFAGDFTFESDHSIYYNIRPCQDAECDPYFPTTTGTLPVIASELPDLVLDGGIVTTIRVDAQDPDGDAVTLSASSSCPGVTPLMDGNLLTLTPSEKEIFCEITVSAQSEDGKVSRSFDVLVLDESFYAGTAYDIGSSFINGTFIDKHLAYLEGDVSIRGDRGYSNQAFFVWVEDESGSAVIDASDSAIFGTLSPGFYTICASLRNPFTFYYYDYDIDHSGYILSVSAPESLVTVEDLAEALGIDTATAGESDPVVTITVLDGTGVVPFDADFTSMVTSGTPPYTFLWDFGDEGDDSVEANPEYTYIDAGVYTVTCQVADSEGRTAFDTAQIKLNDAITILTDSMSDGIVYSGNEVTIYGNGQDNGVEIENGARVALIHFPGNNSVTLPLVVDAFSIYRSGATVFFDGDDGTTLSMPSTLENQTLHFIDRTLLLRIESGNVMLGENSLETVLP